MSFSLKKIIGLAVLASCCAATPVMAQAPTKIGLIDLKKVFDNYYKTKQADAQLRERAGDSDKVLKGMREDFQKTGEEYRKLVDSANDQAVSSEEREKRKKSAETKLTELQELEKNAATFQRQTQATLDEQKRRLRDNILKEIRDVVGARAKNENYTVMLDTAAESINQTPVLVFSNGQNDVTDDVLKELNKNAPANVPVADSPKDSEKEKKK